MDFYAEECAKLGEVPEKIKLSNWPWFQIIDWEKKKIEVPVITEEVIRYFFLIVMMMGCCVTLGINMLGTWEKE